MGIMDILGGAAESAANALTGGAAGNVINGLFGNSQADQNKRAEDFAKGQQERQISGAKELAANNQMLQMQNWNATNYESQMEHMKNAGLNPALLYGKGGGGGATMGGSMGMGMPTAQSAPDQSQGGRNAMDIAMMGAQTTLMREQANKTKIEADKLAGVDTGKGEQEINASKQAVSASETQQKGVELDNQLKAGTLIDQMAKISADADIAARKAQSATANAEVDINTVTARIKQIRQEATNEGIKAVAMKAGIALDNAKITEISNDITRKWDELTLQQGKVGYEHSDRLTAIQEYTKNALKVAGINAAARVISDVVSIATKQVPKGGRTETRDNNGNHTVTDRLIDY